MSPPAKETSRLLAVDAMRFVAAFGIIWIHTVESPRLTTSIALGRFGVPFFAVASLWLQSQSMRRKPELKWKQYAASRAILLYGSFLLWNAIYFLARWLKHRVFHTGSPLSWDISILWGGVSEQMWFLPVLLAACLIAFQIFRAGINSPRVAMLLGLLFMIAAVLACCMPLPGFVRDEGTNNLVQAVYFLLPALLLSVTIGLLYPWLERVLRSPIATVLAAIVFVISIYVLTRLGRSAACESIAGVAAFVASLTMLRAGWIDRVGKLGAFAMGIYLSHVLWIEMLQAVAHRAGAPVAVWLDCSVAVASLLGALLTSYLLRRTILVPR